MPLATTHFRTSGIPPLENGDRLTRMEFERRYDAMPDVKKAELIEGVVRTPARVRFEQHGSPHADLVTLLGTYRLHTPGVRVGDNASVRLDLDNEPQPDVVLLIEPELGGQASIDGEGYIAGAPELVAEIASSSASIDLGPKLHVFRRNGVKEYLVWRVLDQAIDWFVLRDGQYEPLSLQADLYKSEVFPGLWLNVAELLKGNLAAVHQTLQQGLADDSHQEFLESLKQKGPA